MEKTLYLITSYEHGSAEETERLVNAETRAKAVQHVIAVNKAWPA